MFYLISIVLAAICKATADALFSHPATFPFKGTFWGVYTPSTGYLPFTHYPINAWHFANSGMIIFFIAACFFYKQQIFWFKKNWMNRILEFILVGTLFILIFNLFYNKIY